MPKMQDTSLVSICEAHMNNALGWVGGLLSKKRTEALTFYRGDPFGNEQDGRSQVVSRDVAEAIDGTMPSLMKIFGSGANVVAFKPLRPDAEQTAKQATDYVNHVVYSQQDYFDLVQTWIKDGLLSKLGVVKCWWEESTETVPEEYEGLTQVQFIALVTDPDVEIDDVKITTGTGEILDPAEVVDRLTQQQSQQPQIGQPPPQAGPGQLPQTPANFPGIAQSPQNAAPANPPMANGQSNGAPNALMPSPMAGNPIQAMLDNGLSFHVKLSRHKNNGRICIEAIPPEEFLTDRRAVSLDPAHCTFACHRSIRTVTDLIEMGFPREKVSNLSGGTELDFNTEVLTRFRSEDEAPQRDDVDALDPAMRHVWVGECYLKVDRDGDGVAEWNKVMLAGVGSGGSVLLSDEPCDGHPFSAWTPIKEPHKLYGDSLAEKTMDIQLIKSTVWRQTLDGMYFNNAPQLIVQEGQVNMEDVLTRRPGGVIRARSQGSIEPLTVQDMSQSGMGMLGYLDSVREARTGIRRWSPGLEGSEINPLATTATGVNAVSDSTQDTMELLARNFAEQGLKPLFRKVLELVCKYQDKPKTVRLRGTWVDIDPSTWDTDMDMEVMVGLGTGDNDQRIAALGSMLAQIDFPIIQMQQGLQGPLITADNLYNKLNKITEAMGYRQGDNFYTNPKEAPPQQPKPDPLAQKAQAEIQLAQQKAAMELQQKRVEAGLNAQLEQAKAMKQAEVERAQAEASIIAERQKGAVQIEIARQKALVDLTIKREEATLNHAIKVHDAKTTARLAAFKAMSQFKKPTTKPNGTSNV